MIEVCLKLPNEVVFLVCLFNFIIEASPNICSVLQVFPRLDILFVSLEIYVRISHNIYSVLQVFPMLDILTKEFSTKGPVQISVGIRVDISIYQVGA